MRSFFSRVASIAGLAAALGLSAPVAAQLTVTDGGRTSTTCTSYTVSYSSSAPSTPTITLSPSNCMSGDPPPPSGPYFRFAANNATSSGEAAAVTAGGAANLTYTVELVRNGNVDPLSVAVEACRAGTNCTALAGQDYYLEAGFSWASPYVMTLQFAGNETSKTFVVAAADDQIVDGSKVLTFTLVNPTSVAVIGSPGTHALTLTDNEAAPTTAANFDVVAPAIFENTPLGFIGVSRANGTGSAAVTVQVQPSSTAVLGTNYALDYAETPFSGSPASYTINFAAGETSKGFYVSRHRRRGLLRPQGRRVRVHEPREPHPGHCRREHAYRLRQGPAPVRRHGIRRERSGDTHSDGRTGFEHVRALRISGFPRIRPGSLRFVRDREGCLLQWHDRRQRHQQGVALRPRGLHARQPAQRQLDPRRLAARAGHGVPLQDGHRRPVRRRFRRDGRPLAHDRLLRPDEPWCLHSRLRHDFRAEVRLRLFEDARRRRGANANGCYKNMGTNDSLLGKIYPTGTTAPANSYPYCTLKPDTVYYLNMRFEDVTTVSSQGLISCPIGGGPLPGVSNCGFAMTFN